ncbi:MAG: ATP synthase F1 subunit epsilon [Muribaculaceae bacterium]|nr:ATP synthase F1 subunit epsilon [Muribaculaceae bacterium]MDE6549612.1 ATP synthase F1 subunit epsilon [Muribaculaceae bacterium]MDE6560004.1 ATP synthase F1 subunit epsilon [Muribaculaceae bacterium]
MTLEIISPQEVVFKGDAESVTLPGELGKFTVLKNHAPLISVLVEGSIAYRTPSGEENTYAIKGGLADVDNNVISVCIY